MADRFSKFNGEAMSIFTFAQEEADRFNQNYIGTEHLLLGLLDVEGSVAHRVLVFRLGLELAKVRLAVEFVISIFSRGGDRMVQGYPGFTPRSEKVIELALDESKRLKHDYVGTEHVLLGIVREGEGLAAGVMGSLGVKLETVEEAVLLELEYPSLEQRVESKYPFTPSQVAQLIEAVIGIPLVRFLAARHERIALIELLSLETPHPALRFFPELIAVLEKYMEISITQHFKVAGVCCSSIDLMRSEGVNQSVDRHVQHCEYCRGRRELFRGPETQPPEGPNHP